MSPGVDRFPVVPVIAHFPRACIDRRIVSRTWTWETGQPRHLLLFNDRPRFCSKTSKLQGSLVRINDPCEYIRTKRFVDECKWHRRPKIRLLLRVREFVGGLPLARTHTARQSRPVNASIKVPDSSGKNAPRSSRHGLYGKQVFCQSRERS